MKKTNKIIASILVALMLILCISTNTFANYQANGNTGTEKYEYEWIGSIRNMEADGQVMGLTEEYNNDLTPTSTNNIDVHQIKNTEWGAIAILSASLDYGKKPTNSEDLTTRYVFNRGGTITSTGNAYGIYYYNNHSQWMATDTETSKWSGADSRYINTYSYNNYVGKDGDAMFWDWHHPSGLNSTFSWFNSSSRTYSRGYNSLFQFNGTQQYNNQRYQTRACIVCGQGY